MADDLPSPTNSRLSLSQPKSLRDSPRPRPLCVSLLLSSRPFRTTNPRRDLTTAYKVFKGLWASLEKCDVLRESCTRLGERAAEVLSGVEGKLQAVEREGGVGEEKGYEFKGSAGADNRLKIQS